MEVGIHRAVDNNNNNNNINSKTKQNKTAASRSKNEKQNKKFKQRQWKTGNAHVDISTMLNSIQTIEYSVICQRMYIWALNWRYCGKKQQIQRTELTVFFVVLD